MSHVENIRDRWRRESFGVRVKSSKSRKVRHEIAYTREKCGDNLGALSGNDARDTGEIVGTPTWSRAAAE